MNFAINPWVAIGVLASTAATDAAYVFFNAAVSSRRRVWAANWSSIWYMLSAFAVISYTENALYVAFAALGSWLGAYASVTWLHRGGHYHRSFRRRRVVSVSRPDRQDCKSSSAERKGCDLPGFTGIRQRSVFQGI